MKCPRCLATVTGGDGEKCPKCGSPLPLPAGNGALRDAVKFGFIAPLYSKPRLVYNELGELVDVETEFRLYRALKEPAQPPFIIYDADGYVNVRRHEYALVKLDVDAAARLAQAVPGKVWRSMLGSHNINAGDNGGGKHPILQLWDAGVLVTPVPRLRSVDFLRSMDWRRSVEGIIDFKGVKVDGRLRLVRLTHLMRGVKQSINPHALIVLPGQTGKSEWYKHVGICEDKVSANSLIGYADADGPRPGSIDGSDLPFALDQIESSGMYTIFRYMLGLMEFGEARVDMAAFPFNIHSTAVFAILSNPVGDAKSNFAVLLEKLSRNPALGRRFGIILYDKEAVRIERREKDMDALKEKVSLFRAVEEYCLPELRRILNDEEVWGWLNERNEEFIKQAVELIAPIEAENENLYLFLKEFVENGGSHTRGGALRAALTLNLDRIALKEHNIEDLLTEAEEFLSDLLRINFESIRLIAATYQETKEQGDLRAFDMLPTYLKEIVSAVELWRRGLKDGEKAQLRAPLSFYLNTLDYKPKTEEYFSKVLDAARKGNPEKHNENLKAHFQFEVKKERDGLVAVVYSVDPMPHLKVFGTFVKFGNFEDFEGDASSKNGDKEGGKEGEMGASTENSPPQILPNFPKDEAEDEEAPYPKSSKITKITKIPKITKDKGESIDVRRCGECKHWEAGRCLLRLDWVVVMPTHPACERFEPREEAAQV